MTQAASLKTVQAGRGAPVLVSFNAVSKRFGSTVALAGVTLEAVGGSVHAVTGENGAGKSTLMNLLAGVLRPDEGTIALSGRPVVLDSPGAARAQGVSTIFQELTLLPNLTVAENLFLGREPRRFGLTDTGEMRKRARAALARLDSSISVDSFCGMLSVGEQQMVEIAKGIVAQADIFILDEPTAALNAPEVQKLAELIAVLRAEGKLIFYISHRLEEIFNFCDTVSVMKDGQLVATHPTAAIDRDTLISLMVGRELGQLFPPRNTSIEQRGTVLEMRGIATTAFDARVSFALARGEILGLAGLEGQGQRALIRAVSGLEPPIDGSVTKIAANGARSLLQSSVVATARAGIGFIPEDRKTEGLYLPLSIATNITLGMLREQSVWSRARVAAGEIETQMKNMRVAAASTQQIVGALSGGNQQKVMIGRWLASKVDVLLIEEPTRGVDVGAKAEIYALLRAFTDAGGAILITSSELTEVIGLCDRIAVVREGALVAEFAGIDATEQIIMHAALTGSQTHPQELPQ
ncbi:sugar ABC transporter ATP-binding protein [Sulfitobacter guttiformis]|uniref:Monosaccharide ABC transporter ATP-binding protein (CUT2 family) n=1 Tax=Sulfitobacter guttiformis TaxID=74349 RepID=A0A420DUB6_9RHOB|nr:sugar ABC transporter ATP-binding protein [Sulfitobacter guttiformis]KIN71317.1 ABC-type sugar transport system, ATPase component [Sulfitobacter guttiformis KCTC 32187]RKE97770.1 monosaccharide ABC transporter ATP-binding protein (CUT2 family) [Sulfitobacter guttiformis]